MASSQIAITLNTSIPGSTPFLLTKDVLQYKGKKFSSFALYPFFDPMKPYPRDLIQDLPYDKRLEIFFIQDKFEAFVLNDQSQEDSQNEEWRQEIRTLEKEVAELTQDIDVIKETINWTEDPEIPKLYNQKTRVYDEKKNKLKSLQEKIGNQAELNFEFTVKIILSTAFPVNNYYQSIDFYGKVQNKSTIKGINLDWIPVLPYKYSKMFSYLKSNGKIYTVSQVIWVNDVFNHPRYKRIIESYEQNSKKESDVSADNIKKLQEKNEKTKKKIIDDLIWIPNWKIENFNVTERSQNARQVMLKINEIAKILIQDKKNVVQENADLFLLNINFKSSKTDTSHLELFSNLSKYKAKNATETLSGIQLLELKKIILTDENLEILKEDQKNPAVKKQIEEFQKNRNDILTMFYEIVKLYYDELLGMRMTYSQELRPCVLKMKTCAIREKALLIISNEKSDYSNDLDKKEIQEYIQKNFKNYSVFSKDLEILRKERKISNPEWYEITSADSSTKQQSIQKKLFQKILNCKIKPKSCMQNDDVVNSLKVYLDEISEQKGGISETIYDAYLVINVIEGEITVDNYQNVKCAFLNHSLGAMVKKFKSNTNQNNIESTKTFFSLVDELKVEQKSKTQKQQKKGGSATKKRRGRR